MNKTTIWRLLLGGTFAAACAAAAPGQAQTAQQKKLQGAKITLLAVQMPQYQALWAQIPEFEKKYGIKVTLDESGFDQMREKTLLDMSKGAGRYDVFMVDVMWLAEYASAKYLEPLPKFIANPGLTEADFDVDDILPRIYSGSGVWDGVVYNIPIGAGSVGTTFRKDLMAQAGLKVPGRFDGSWTTDAFMDAVKKLNQPEKGIAGYVTQPQRWHWGWTFTQVMAAFQKKGKGGDEFVDRNWKVTINSPENLAAMKWYLGLQPYLPKGNSNFGYPEVLSLYQQGKAAGAISYSEFIPGHFEDPKLKTIQGNNVHLHTPVGPNGGVDPFFGAWGLAISKDAKNKEAAWTFIQWITAKQQMKLALKGGTAPTRHSTFKSAELKEYQPWQLPMYDYMLKMANPDERVRVPEWAQISDVMGLYGSKAWVGEIKPEEALARMEKEMTAAFKKGGYYKADAKNPPQHWRDLKYYERKPSQWN
jgi:multiple sugar transport system substrate-binding protein